MHKSYFFFWIKESIINIGLRFFCNRLVKNEPDPKMNPNSSENFWVQTRKFQPETRFNPNPIKTEIYGLNPTTRYFRKTVSLGFFFFFPIFDYKPTLSHFPNCSDSREGMDARAFKGYGSGDLQSKCFFFIRITFAGECGKSQPKKKTSQHFIVRVPSGV